MILRPVSIDNLKKNKYTNRAKSNIQEKCMESNFCDFDSNQFCAKFSPLWDCLCVGNKWIHADNNHSAMDFIGTCTISLVVKMFAWWGVQIPGEVEKT